jgi:hypothetical protein
LYDPILTSAPAALLVDGENFHAPNAAKLAEVTAEYGPQAIRRVYGSADQIKPWDDHGYRMCPTRPGKNSADMLLCVQAMRLMLHDGVKTIIIASSDRDYTYLAEELRELGARVIGVGGSFAVPSFRNSCARFIVVEAEAPKVQTKPKETAAAPPAAEASATKVSPAALTATRPAVSKLLRAVESIIQTDGAEREIPVHLLGAKLGQKHRLSPKEFGAARWPIVFRGLQQFEVKKIGNHSFLRLKG